MSLKGVRQLKQLLIRYSDRDGSSKGIRDWMRESLIPFAEKNPEIIIKTEMKRNVHPFVSGKYLNTNNKTICVKNIPPEEVYNYILDLRNQIGRRMNSTGYKRPVITQRPSIQGEWHERMDLIDLQLSVVNKEVPVVIN